MSQRDFLRSFDADAFAAFSATGLGDRALYTPAAGTDVACTVLVDRGAREFGEDEMPVAVTAVRITVQRAEVGEGIERRGDIVKILDDAGQVVETLALQRLERSDESSECWWAVPHA